MTTVSSEWSAGRRAGQRSGVPTEGQRRRLEHADLLMRLAIRIDLPLILLAGLTMAVGRYLGGRHRERQPDETPRLPQNEALDT
jgi:hypothetical protein